MATFLKSASGKFITLNSHKILIKKPIASTVFYPLVEEANGNQSVVIPLNNGKQLSIVASELGWEMSADFDLVIVADSSYFESKVHCGYYYVSYAIANCGDDIYIYDHNSYENGWVPAENTGDSFAEGQFIYENYTPLATIWFEITSSDTAGWWVEQK